MWRKRLYKMLITPVHLFQSNHIPKDADIFRAPVLVFLILSIFSTSVPFPAFENFVNYHDGVCYNEAP
ncbi:MAG: hypothetical protein R6U19_05350, partial [Bacteroidales bacterium]